VSSPLKNFGVRHLLTQD